MIEGLWTMQYLSGRGTLGTAVVVFSDGRVYGGDANYYLAGEYSLTGDEVLAVVDMVNYSSRFQSIFGPVDECVLRMRGSLQGAVIEGHGWLADNAEQRVNVILRRRAELGAAGRLPADPDVPMSAADGE